MDNINDTIWNLRRRMDEHWDMMAEFAARLKKLEDRLLPTQNVVVEKEPAGDKPGTYRATQETAKDIAVGVNRLQRDIAGLQKIVGELEAERAKLWKERTRLNAHLSAATNRIEELEVQIIRERMQRDMEKGTGK